MKTFYIEVYGRVQGVFFRRTVKRFADEIGIKGTVKNQSDGSVLIAAQGSELQLKKFIIWIESSPGFSNVERAEIEEKDIREEFYDFRIIFEKSFIEDKKKSFGNLGKSLF